VQQGITGDAVRAVQSQVHSCGDGASQIIIDGLFGPVTDNAVRAFQALLGLSVRAVRLSSARCCALGRQHERAFLAQLQAV
jgi:peptidoglycan hydrolase-like protein with peptidoglycan-binding domain